MKQPVIHKECGTVVGYYTGIKDGPERSSDTFEFLDGTHPLRGSLIQIHCHTCKRLIKDTYELKRGN